MSVLGDLSAQGLAASLLHVISALLTAWGRAWLLLRQLIGPVTGKLCSLATSALDLRAVTNSFRSPETKLPLAALEQPPKAQLPSSTWGASAVA